MDFKSILTDDIDIFLFDADILLSFDNTDTAMYTGFDFYSDILAEYIIFQPAVLFLSILRFFSKTYYDYFLVEITD